MIVFLFALVCCSPAQQLYRKAEIQEEQLLWPQAISTYKQVLWQKNRLWSRRAAYRIASLIRNHYFAAGRSESIRPYIVSLYKSLLADIPSLEHDPELWFELRKEIPGHVWGLKAPYAFLIAKSKTLH